ADSFECFAHQHQAFFFDLDDPATGPRVWLQRMTTNRARGRRGLVQEKRDCHVAPSPQAFRVDPLRLLSISTAINYIVDDGVEIKLLAVDFIGNTYEVLGLHQLKLMAYRRNDTLVSLLCMFDEIAIAMLHFLLNDSTPAKSMIR